MTDNTWLTPRMTGPEIARLMIRHHAPRPAWQRLALVFITIFSARGAWAVLDDLFAPPSPPPATTMENWGPAKLSD